MEPLKPLDALCKRDIRHAMLDGTLEDLYQSVGALELPDHVPETVRSAFAVARMLKVYGWYYWPFHTLAQFHVLLALDMALAIRIAKEDAVDTHGWKSPSLGDALERAISERWITDDGITYVQRIREQVRRDQEAWGAWTDETLPDPWEESDQRYCRILERTLPFLRNTFAHPKHYWHGMPRTLEFENVHDLICQLFPDEESREVDPDNQ